MTQTPVIIIVSQDTFLIGRAVKSLEEEILQSLVVDFNFDRFFIKDTDTATILDACCQLPVMAPIRLVIAHGVESIRKEDMDLWINYFEDPLQSTRLVLTGDKIDRRLKLWQRATKAGWVRELRVPYENEMPQWLVREARELDLKLSPEACRALCDCLGTNLMSQFNTLEKIKTYIMPRKEVDIKDVEECTGGPLSKTIFDFTDAVGNGRYGEATRLLDLMIELGEPLVRLLFMTARHFRLLLLAAEGLRENLSEQDLVRRMGVHSYFVHDYIRQARKIPQGHLSNIYEEILVTDRQLKSSPIRGRLVIETFLLKSCLRS